MDTNKRAVQLKTSVVIQSKTTSMAARKEPAHLNFIAMEEFNPKAADYGVTNEHHKASLDNYFAYMRSLDDRFFSWLEADANNAILFANDPLKAIKIAIPDFDESVLNGFTREIFK
jgi:hypothetical protein